MRVVVTPSTAALSVSLVALGWSRVRVDVKASGSLFQTLQLDAADHWVKRRDLPELDLALDPVMSEQGRGFLWLQQPDLGTLVEVFWLLSIVDYQVEVQWSLKITRSVN